MSTQTNHNGNDWASSVLAALRSFEMTERGIHLTAIYERVAFLRSRKAKPLNRTFHATVRRTLQGLGRKGVIAPAGRKGFWKLVE